MASQLSSLIVPTLFGQQVIDASLEKNALVSSGVVSSDSVISQYLQGAGTTFTFPSFINPDSTGTAANVPTGDSAQRATPEVITGHAQKFIKNARSKSFTVNGIVPNIVGRDPLDAVIENAAGLMNQWRQRSLIAQLDALLLKSSAVVSSNANKLAAESIAAQGAGTKLGNNGSDIIIDTLGGAWGDQGAGQTALLMHSDVYRALVKTNKTNGFVPPAIESMYFQNYLGFPVLVDDSLGKRAGTTDGVVYTVYALRVGGVAFGQATFEPSFELERDSLAGNGAGAEIATIREYFGFHVPGTSFTGSIAGDVPTDVELGTANKYAKVLNSKQIGIAAFTVNL